MENAALGFRVKSGWAMAVLIAGPVSAPQVIDRRRVELADTSVPGSVQPFHAGLDLPKAAGAKVVARLVRVVEQYSERAISELLKRYGETHRVIAAGLAVGSTADPATIANDHIRAHAEEGRLFRVVIENVLKKARLRSSVIPEKELTSKAVKALGIPEQRLKAELIKMGKTVDGPWRSEEKAATLVAWLALNDRSK
jgi:hypothetical protein